MGEVLEGKAVDPQYTVWQGALRATEVRGGLGYGSGGDAGGTTVGGFAEKEAAGAVLGVGLEFVLDVWNGAGSEVALVELDGAVAIFATELGVSVDEGFGDSFYFPEGLVTGTGGADAAAFDFTFI
jgi:hypothetical protein